MQMEKSILGTTIAVVNLAGQLSEGHLYPQVIHNLSTKFIRLRNVVVDAL
jgi:hypothetical protein